MRENERCTVGSWREMERESRRDGGRIDEHESV